MSYSRKTYDSFNPLARFAHRQRFYNSILSIIPANGVSILDYGCGDGKFLNELLDKYKDKELKLAGFEPLMESIEANKIKIVKTLQELNAEKFDFVTCFEVLEHFSKKNQESIFKDFISLLKQDGKLIISVPIEIGFPAIIKNLRRKYSFKGQQFTFKNILKSIRGTPMPEYRDREGYLDHMGFNYKDLELLFVKFFIIKSKMYSPFKSLGPNFNSQVFYELTLKHT